MDCNIKGWPSGKNNQRKEYIWDPVEDSKDDKNCITFGY